MMNSRGRTRGCLRVGLALAALVMMGAAGCQNQRSEGGQRLWSALRRDVGDLPGNMWEDSKLLVQDPTNVGILLVGGGASGYARCAQDDRVERHFEDRHAFPRDFSIGVGVAGNPATHLAVAGAAYIYGVMAENEPTYQVAGTVTEALALTGLYTVGLKWIAQADRPNGQRRGWPSGHTSSTVALATVMHEYFGPWVGLPMYGLSGLVMYQRMETRKHWASDVIFGAAIGYTVGRTVAGKYRPQLFGMDVLPYISPESGATGVVLARSF